MIKHYAPLIFFFMGFFGTAQTVTVLDKQTKEPITGATLCSMDHSKSTITNTNGHADIQAFSDTDLIVIQHVSYMTFMAIKKDIVKLGNTILLTEKTQGLEEVVVSVSRFTQKKRDIPQKVISLKTKDVQFSNPQTSADLLGKTGNVFIQKSQLGGGSPMIRGFSTNRLLITVDDVRMNNAIFRGGNLQNVISIDPFAVQNTEITLGSGSVLYGSDAIGGVMSFYTQKPQVSGTDSLVFNTNAIMRYATANQEKTGHIDFNIGLKQWAFLTNVSYTDFDDLRMGSHGPDDYLRNYYMTTVDGMDTMVENDNPLLQKPTGYDQINLMEKIRYQPYDNLFFDLGLHYSATSNYARYDRLIRYRGDHLRSAEWYYGPQKWFMANLGITRLSSKSNLYDKLKLTTAYQNFKESRHDRDFQSPLKNNRHEAVDAYTFNLDLDKKLTAKTELNYGLEYIFNKVTSHGTEVNIQDGTETQTLSRYPNGSTWQSMAAYASLKYKPNTKFVLQSGLRYNHILSHADFRENNQFLNLPFDKANLNTGALTGTTGITWAPNQTIQWRLNASTAFRAPNIDDIGKVFDSEPGSVVVPNNNLKPEYAVGGDLGLRLNFGDVVKVDLATYYTYLDNALVRRDFSINGDTEIMYDGELSNVQAIQNASKAWIYGFEAGVQVNFTEQIKWTSQYNIIGGTEDDNGIEVPVRHVAPSFGNTHLVYDGSNLKLDAFLDFNGELSYNQLAPSETGKDYIYALDVNGNPYAPSWYTLNVRTQYQFSETIELTASLENITDQRYQTYSSGIAAPGRNLILALKYSI